MLTVVNADGSAPIGSLIEEIVREGARRIRAAALEAEVNRYIAESADRRDSDSRHFLVHTGYHQTRTVTTAAGTARYVPHA
ncbi:hypothetical protein V2J94_43265 [Streptomyces sp. DSM 41524]|uniref:Transposase n=1 Tax=Streptomyces asiaticus subsp. ignotus TaxID=3098222 RepID=A0ABU7QC79_9ACTN|nr:hypothetical protein [Streptomyces sp. DSM 41524]